MSQLPPVTYDIEYPYTRTTGPVVGAFLTALRDGRILASRCGERVICPPVESDPETGDSIPVDLVEVGPLGTVQNWTWIEEPSSKHPFQEPFAFALVLLDGADTTLCHAVRASGMEAMSTGMRVRAQWREERASAITDPRRQIDCAELYVPFSWYEPMWLEGHLLCEEGEGWKLTDEGVTERSGTFPVNMSGGVLSSNPIGASGMIRCLEAANQVRGTAGDYQIDGARVALGHAYGGAANYFAMWLVSTDKEPSFQ